MSRTATLFAASLGAASAQDWGTQGAWTQVIPSTGAGGPVGFAQHHPTAVAGTLHFAGNDPATGRNTSWNFDVASSTWSEWNPLPAGTSIRVPFMTTVGGLVVLLSEDNPNALFWINSANPIGWSQLLAPGAAYPTGANARIGQRFIDWGGSLYAFGGCDGIPIPGGDQFGQHNDLWGLDFQSLMQNIPGAAGWVQISPDSTAAGFPTPRVGFSFTGFTIVAVLFGGVSLLPTAPAGSTPYMCFQQAFRVNCEFHQHVHGLLPHNRLPTAGGITGTSWIDFANAGAYGGPVPTGRFEHAAGYVGDQLFVRIGRSSRERVASARSRSSEPCEEQQQAGGKREMQQQRADGKRRACRSTSSLSPPSPPPSPHRPSQIFGGITATGFSTEMWAYNLHSQTWAQVAQTNPWPTNFYGTGLVLGTSFWVITPVEGGGGANALWRWEPTASSGAGSSPNVVDAPHPGTVAGLVIAILLGLVNAGFAGYTFFQARAGGVKSVSASSMGDVYAQVPGA